MASRSQHTKLGACLRVQRTQGQYLSNKHVLVQTLLFLDNLVVIIHLIITNQKLVREWKSTVSLSLYCSTVDTSLECGLQMWQMSSASDALSPSIGLKMNLKKFYNDNSLAIWLHVRPKSPSLKEGMQLLFKWLHGTIVLSHDVNAATKANYSPIHCLCACIISWHVILRSYVVFEGSNALLGLLRWKQSHGVTAHGRCWRLHWRRPFENLTMPIDPPTANRAQEDFIFANAVGEAIISPPLTFEGSFVMHSTRNWRLTGKSSWT